MFTLLKGTAYRTNVLLTPGLRQCHTLGFYRVSEQLSLNWRNSQWCHSVGGVVTPRHLKWLWWWNTHRGHDRNCPVFFGVDSFFPRALGPLGSISASWSEAEHKREGLLPQLLRDWSRGISWALELMARLGNLVRPCVLRNQSSRNGICELSKYIAFSFFWLNNVFCCKCLPLSSAWDSASKPWTHCQGASWLLSQASV